MLSSALGRNSASSGGFEGEGDDGDEDSFAYNKPDPTIARFTERLPLLEHNKTEAKAGLNEAERMLHRVLGRKPIEVERRDDEQWARAAIAYREAEQALFLAKSMTSWDD